MKFLESTSSTAFLGNGRISTLTSASHLLTQRGSKRAFVYCPMRRASSERSSLCAQRASPLQRSSAFHLSYLVCVGAGVVEGGGHGGGGERVLSGGEGGGRRLNERRRVSKGAQAPLLGQELLVRYRVYVGWEAEGGTEEEGNK